MPNFYDGTKLLSLKDINGNVPEIFICTSNRSAGKTTYFNRLAVNRWNKNKRDKFCLLYRYNYELDSVPDKFFKDIAGLFFPGLYMRSEKRAKGIYHELFIGDIKDEDRKGGISCGYAVALNYADQIKKYSHLLSDTTMMIFDEFQSETNHYCADEITKFTSIHWSVARGAGKQSRYLPVYMIGNPISLINPYYVALGISSRLKNDTRFLRGDGFVLEQGYNQSAAEAQQESAFNRAFAKNNYIAYAAQGVYLNDNIAFIEKPTGRSKYLCTLRYNSKDYAVREFAEDGYLYCDDRADTSFKQKIAVTTDDHRINYVMLRNNDFYIMQLRYYFEKGCFRFKDLSSKEVIMKAISY